VIDMLKSQYSTSLLCDLLGLARSSYYYQPEPSEERDLRQAIESIAAQFPTYGSRRIAHQLGRAPFHLTVNRKRARRVMGEMGLFCRVKRRSVRTTNSRHHFPRYENLVRELKLTRPDEVWVADITYIKLREEFIYLAIIMDVFTRAIRGWSLGRGLGVELTLGALEQALLKGAPEIHHSDQGLQYAAAEYVVRLSEVRSQISMAEVGQAEQNGYAERVIRTIKEEEVALNDYHDIEDARAQIGRFIDDVYLSKRIHSSLGYLTPAEFEQQWHEQRRIAAILKTNR
jgi:transposase InsO family protein